jgi:hypothetical protein
MMTPELEQMTRRLSVAEQEIARAHADIRALREQCIRYGPVRAIVSAVVIVAAVSVTALWSATTQAQGPGQPSTVKAPFIVVDAAGRPIMKVEDSNNIGFRGVNVYGPQGGVAAGVSSDPSGNGYVNVHGGVGRTGGVAMFMEERGPVFRMLSAANKNLAEFTSESTTFSAPVLRLTGTDDKAFAEFKKDGAMLHAPFQVNDRADAKIVDIVDGSPRGLTVYNKNRKEVVSIAADLNSDGLVVVRNKTAGYGTNVQFTDGEPEITLQGKDNKYFARLQRTGSNVVGPFTVNDAADKPVMIVQEERTTEVKDASGQTKPTVTSRGAHVYNAQGFVVARTSVDSDGNGRFVAKDSTGKGATVGMMITKQGSLVAVAGNDGKTRVSASASEGLVVYNSKGTPVGSLGATPGEKGFLEVNDESGARMVEAGSTPDGKGVVKVNPWQVRVDPLGQPSVLMGGKKP